NRLSPRQPPGGPRPSVTRGLHWVAVGETQDFGQAGHYRATVPAACPRPDLRRESGHHEGGPTAGVSTLASRTKRPERLAPQGASRGLAARPFAVPTFGVE